MKLIAITLLFSAALFCQSVPDVQVKTLEGKTVSLKSCLGKGPTLILFWATWCAPCKKELDSYMDYYSDLENDGVTVLAISTDDPRTAAKVRPTVEAKKYAFTVLLDPNQDCQRAFSFSTVPYSVLINKKGTIVHTHSGYKPGDEAAMVEKINTLLGKQP